MIKAMHSFHNVRLVDTRINHYEAHGDRRAYDVLSLIVTDESGDRSTVAVFFDGDAVFAGVDILAGPSE